MCDTIGVTTGNSNLFHALYGAYNVHILNMSHVEKITQGARHGSINCTS